MIGTDVGHYRITNRIGAGAMGEVFLADDTRLERKAAIKFLPSAMADDPERRQRFVKEAKAASALNHPHVCVVYEVGESECGLPFIAMEYVEGQSLDVLIEDGPLPVRHVVRIAEQVADALEAAHTSQIVHRDIKPANIRLNERGQVKVLDFGLAKRIAQPTDGHDTTCEMDQTLDGKVVGTPAYMSPEQSLGKPLDHRSDLFSLGAVVYCMLTGRGPFAGANVGDVLNNVLNRQPEAIARFNYDVPPELERITLKLLAKETDRRYQSAGDLLVDLKTLQRDMDGGVNPHHSLAASVSARVDAPAENVSDPGEISQSDVVITYANLDDEPVISGRQGWVSQLQKNLQVRVSQLAGTSVNVVKQPDVSHSAETEAAVLEHVPQAKTVVSVLSPPFVKADGCHRIVDRFCQTASETGAFVADEHPRLLNVVKAPVEDSEFPPEVRSLYTGLVPYEFYERDPNSGRLREFDEAFGDKALQRFHERVYDVAYDISQVLKFLGESTPNKTRRTADPKTVFLAATTSDLEPQRDQLRRELIELGHDVVPKQPLPLVASQLMAVVQGCLEQADIAIHFVGEHFGLVPEATELSVVALQNQIAAQFCGNSSLRRLIWIPKGLQARDERQEAFIRQLQCEPETVTGAELIADTLENLKVLLHSRWEREQTQSEMPPPTPTDGAPRVYLICDQQDEQATEPLEDFLYAQGIEVSLPGFEADESEVQQIHIRNLQDCDAALIFYGAAGMHWVDFKIRDLQKAAGYRDSRPIPVSGVYVAPPFNRRKERFKSVSADVIRQPDETFDPHVLEKFVAKLREAKEAK